MTAIRQQSRLVLFMLAIMALVFTAIAPVYAEAKWIDASKVKATLKPLDATYYLNVTTDKPKTSNIDDVYVRFNNKEYRMSYNTKKDIYTLDSYVKMSSKIPSTLTIKVVKKDGTQQVSDDVKITMDVELAKSSKMKVTKSSFIKGTSVYQFSGSLVSKKVSKITAKIGTREYDIKFDEDTIEDFEISTDVTTIHFTIMDNNGLTQEFDVPAKK